MAKQNNEETQKARESRADTHVQHIWMVSMNRE